MNKDRRDHIKTKLQKKIRNAQEQLDMLDALDSYEAFGAPYPPVGARKEKTTK